MFPIQKLTPRSAQRGSYCLPRNWKPFGRLERKEDGHEEGDAGKDIWLESIEEG